jgi:hypothetical protein
MRKGLLRESYAKRCLSLNARIPVVCPLCCSKLHILFVIRCDQLPRCDGISLVTIAYINGGMQETVFCAQTL